MQMQRKQMHAGPLMNVFINEEKKNADDRLTFMSSLRCILSLLAKKRLLAFMH